MEEAETLTSVGHVARRRSDAHDGWGDEHGVAHARRGNGERSTTMALLRLHCQAYNRTCSPTTRCWNEVCVVNVNGAWIQRGGILQSEYHTEEWPIAVEGCIVVADERLQHAPDSRESGG